MARLTYPAIASLDGYVADEDGTFDWAMPDEQVHTFINDLQRPVGTYLYGGRMYETMVGWETADTPADQPSYMREFAAIVVGGGTRSLPDKLCLPLVLRDMRRFGNGMVYLRYRART